MQRMYELVVIFVVRFRSGIEDRICEKLDIPIVQIVVNGGPGTLLTVADGITS